MKRLQTIFTITLLLAITMTVTAQGKSTKDNKTQKVQLGVWEEQTGQNHTVEEIIEWMKPLYEAGIMNYYIDAAPQEIARWVEASKQYDGARVHAWMFSVNAFHDSVEVFKHKDWFEVNRLGENSLDKSPYTPVYKWLSPAVPDARKFIKSKAVKFASIKGLASVHLDFIRFNDLFLGRRTQEERFHIDQKTIEPQWDFGYHPKAIEAFKKRFGYSPLDLSAPYLSPEWIQFRMNEVTSLVNEIALEVHRKGTLVSAAVFPFPERARMMVLQDWARWNVDIVCPMNYSTFYKEGPEWVKFSVEEGLAETRHRNRYISGLFVNNMSNDDLYKQAKLSIEAGADGINFFSASALIKNNQLDIVRRLNKEYNQ